MSPSVNYKEKIEELATLENAIEWLRKDDYRLFCLELLELHVKNDKTYHLTCLLGSAFTEQINLELSQRAIGAVDNWEDCQRY